MGLATRAVMVWPNECWILPPEVYETESSEKTEFEKAWDVLNRDLDLLGELKRVDILSRIVRFGVMVYGFDDLGPNDNFKKPVEGVDELTGEVQRGKGLKLLYVNSYDETAVTVSKRETRKNSRRYGLPVLYSIQVEDPNTSTVVPSEVHWTRVEHFVPNRLSNKIYGEPTMKPAYNDLIDVRKTKGASAEGYWRAALSGIMWGLNDKLVDPNTNMTDDQKEAFLEELTKFHNSMQRDLISFGLVPHDIAPKLIDPSPWLKSIIEQICLYLEIPYRVFMGTEEGKLAGGQDRTAWLERVKGHQNNYVTPGVILPVVLRLQKYGVLPMTTDPIKVHWPERDAPTEKDIAETALKQTQAMGVYQTQGVNNLMGEKQWFSQVLKKTPEEIEEIGKEVEDWEDNTNVLTDPTQVPGPEQSPEEAGDNRSKGIEKTKGASNG